MTHIIGEGNILILPPKTSIQGEDEDILLLIQETDITLKEAVDMKTEIEVEGHAAKRW